MRAPLCWPGALFCRCHAQIRLELPQRRNLPGTMPREWARAALVAITKETRAALLVLQCFAMFCNVLQCFQWSENQECDRSCLRYVCGQYSRGPLTTSSNYHRTLHNRASDTFRWFQILKHRRPAWPRATHCSLSDFHGRCIVFALFCIVCTGRTAKENILTPGRNPKQRSRRNLCAAYLSPVSSHH